MPDQDTPPSQDATADQAKPETDKRPRRQRRFTVEQLMAEMPDGLPRLPEWEDMPPVGREYW